MRHTLKTNSRERANYDLRQARRNKEADRMSYLPTDLDPRRNFTMPDHDDQDSAYVRYPNQRGARAPKRNRAMIYASVALACLLALPGVSQARGVGSAHHVARNTQGRQIGEPSALAVTGFRAYFTRGADGNAK